jgi:hypothetical protein
VVADDEVHLAGNVGGADRVGGTVHRATGPWTPAVHALLGYLADRVPHIPRVLGYDDRGREVLSYLPGHVLDQDREQLSTGQLQAMARWTRAFHDVVTGFAHPGPWRYCPFPGPTLIGHNDIAPYNVCFAGDDITGVFDWDMAGPTTRLQELAFIAWNGVPLWRDTGADSAAERLRIIAASYGGPDAGQILHAVPQRIRTLLDWIPAAAAAGDAGMANLMTAGEPGRPAGPDPGHRPRAGLTSAGWRRPAGRGRSLTPAASRSTTSAAAYPPALTEPRTGCSASPPHTSSGSNGTAITPVSRGRPRPGRGTAARAWGSSSHGEGWPHS